MPQFDLTMGELAEVSASINPEESLKAILARKNAGSKTEKTIIDFSQIGDETTRLTLEAAYKDIIRKLEDPKINKDQVFVEHINSIIGGIMKKMGDSARPNTQ